MKNICKITFKGATKQYFLNFLSGKPPLAPFPPFTYSRLFSLPIPRRFDSEGKID